MPQNIYPLPSVDELVDGALRNEIVSIMDAHLGYNQNLMAKEDEKKTTFVTEWYTCLLDYATQGQPSKG